MRLILENSSEEYIPLNKEIKTLEYYLILQRLRLDDNLTYNITTGGIADIENMNIPPMLTQPFIENAIEHGFKGKSKGGHIEIDFELVRKDILQIKVTDNGKGINHTLNERENKSDHKSMAVEITKERLVVLNRSKRQKVTFSIADISDEKTQTSGTMVIFTIPVL
jgi:sensor histidine kinase YesM